MTHQQDENEKQKHGENKENQAISVKLYAVIVLSQMWQCFYALLKENILQTFVRALLQCRHGGLSEELELLMEEINTKLWSNQDVRVLELNSSRPLISVC